MSVKPIYCPFCGETAAQVKHSPRWGYFVSCACTAVGPGRGSRKGAVEAWNTRVEPIQTVIDFTEEGK